jgi:hypothetical protein
MSEEYMAGMIRKIAEGKYTPDELSAFLRALDELDEASYIRVFNEIYTDVVSQVPGAIDPLFKASLEARLDSLPMEADSLDQSDTPVIRMRPERRWIRWTAAAAAVLLIGGGTYLIHHRINEKPTIAALHYKGDVLPGHNGAVLHLSDGRTVTLDSAQDGTVARQGTVEAVKVNGELKYVGKAKGVSYNDITTGRGRQWQLTLPDGTKVWLNAASSIHYPLTFTGPIREVEITGEAYFEVMHNSGQPFRVKVGDQVIEDIGTAFNINAYRDEPAIKTTLVEGSVRVSAGAANVLVRPGQQASEAGGQLTVSTADVDRATAWRRGIFSYHHTGIEELMRQLARWYNVDVEYKGTIPADDTFTGDMGRNLTLAQVLHGLQGMNVHFSIEEDKRIVIMP